LGCAERSGASAALYQLMSPRVIATRISAGGGLPLALRETVTPPAAARGDIYAINVMSSEARHLPPGLYNGSVGDRHAACGGSR